MMRINLQDMHQEREIILVAIKVGVGTIDKEKDIFPMFQF